MPFQPGHKLATGRPKGTVNRTTEQAKLTINRAVNGILDHINTDLQEIRKKDPVKAMEIAMKLMEYVMPKQRAIDISGEMNLNQRIHQISVNIIDGTENKDIKDV
jgi:hypothetical protein